MSRGSKQKIVIMSMKRNQGFRKQTRWQRGRGFGNGKGGKRKFWVGVKFGIGGRCFLEL
jgi:hypothetical protein